MNAQTKLGAYQGFSRREWAALRDAVPLPLSEEELERLRGINESVSLEEVEAVYLPLSRLLNLYVHSSQRRGDVLQQFLGRRPSKGPYIISVAGSVAVGKSTTARILQALLQRWPEHPQVELVTTDGFLYPLEELKRRDLLKRKGFPESYDIRMLLDFVKEVKSGRRTAAPLYSHLSYDRIENTQQEINNPDILILEGLNVLQSGMDYPDGDRPFVSDFVDFSIYVDAPESLLKSWYIDRFISFRDGAFKDPNSYFHHYAQLSEGEARKTASKIWDDINGPNLNNNILPTRERATLILSKGEHHRIEKIRLRG
ncbi:pantothenate kinase [Ferrimonas balearica DSM 9799]|uniref:Pantothenate kinase n=1 Tax=Ferrimonas balearica (strain DSM 9799 / CCM 4581 / KCTC 23876 / PAT) TaxID=550540 RepID=E1SLQ8_FERBD|nr:type I pantothenate kinase [Ferrimonas balearica]MBY6019829.1 type I pantothenate kinase [Halomonas denitrificans]ADN74457.1 pantothenate kinase [Ferrimonas balearica DSM 9799]MBW3141606.1 type I pantothenate kinase [Ferrimonas balearica]MBW3166600.1 type I pantothenate kinase [Ferrimonas balearica]MBY5982338.1 type I pantothenate kinase [Ferrimonas balearica]